MMFTPESAKAALQLGPVEFVCNTCGRIHDTCLHTSTHRDCVLQRCKSAWHMTYHALNLGLVRAPLGQLYNAVRLLASSPAQHACVLDEIIACRNDLYQALRVFDCSWYVNDVPYNPVYIAFRSVMMYADTAWLLMVSSDCADAQIAQTFAEPLDDMRRKIEAALIRVHDIDPLLESNQVVSPKQLRRLQNELQTALNRTLRVGEG